MDFFNSFTHPPIYSNYKKKKIFHKLNVSPLPKEPTHSGKKKKKKTKRSVVEILFIIESRAGHFTSGNIPAERRNDGRDRGSRVVIPEYEISTEGVFHVDKVSGVEGGIMGGERGYRISRRIWRLFFVREEKLGTGARGGRDIIGFRAFPELLKFEAGRGRGQNENPPPPVEEY